MTDKIQLESSWKAKLQGEFEKPYMKELRQFLVEEKRKGKVIYPPGPEIFNAFNLAPFDKVKVVIIGQDPYHGSDQAHGLCFSVKQGIQTPPSLKNIYKELYEDCDIEIPSHGNLESWAKQGVLLLNAVLTVEQAKAAAHQGKGWETFTDKVIELLNAQKEHLVFMLWGAYAQKKGQMIDRKRHMVLRSTHPSPLSAHRGFLGSRHFSKANSYLERHGVKPVNWAIPGLSPQESTLADTSAD